MAIDPENEPPVVNINMDSQAGAAAFLPAVAAEAPAARRLPPARRVPSPRASTALPLRGSTTSLQPRKHALFISS